MYHETDIQDAVAAAAQKVRVAAAAQDRLAEDLGLDVCAQALSPAAERAVTGVVDEALTSPDPAVCEDLFTENFVDEALGGLQACRKIPAGQLADSVEVERVSGSEGELASVDVVVIGGPDDDSRLNMRLLYEGEQPVVFDQLSLPD